MAKATVYIETSIVSYLTARPSKNLVAAAQQAVTQQWWDSRRADFDLVTSRLVLQEAALGDREASARRLAALANLEILGVNSKIEGLAADVVAQQLMPASAEADALHIAIAAWHGVDLLLTWNCRHIANAERLPSILQFLSGRRVKPPFICTPPELMGDVNAIS